MELLSFNEALDFVLSHTYILQAPIIIDGNNYLIGYNEDEIRKFLPKNTDDIDCYQNKIHENFAMQIQIIRKK
ncbi:ArsC/Spx/MgsR family protein [Lactococcus garvieae]|uniref:ArsC/Spx/MgsR family protein n=1 Tax=Lactococcus garvieae TaxID=1363 RepID=UPI00398F43BF